MSEEATITVTGASDDLIEVDGDITAEFYANRDGGDYLAFSDGTVLRIVYDQDGIWRVTQVAIGSAEFSKKEGVVVEDTFDVVTLPGDIRWVVRGSDMKKATRRARFE